MIYINKLDIVKYILVLFSRGGGINFRRVSGKQIFFYLRRGKEMFM